MAAGGHRTATFPRAAQPSRGRLQPQRPPGGTPENDAGMGRVSRQTSQRSQSTRLRPQSRIHWHQPAAAVISNCTRLPTADSFCSQERDRRRNAVFRPPAEVEGSSMERVRRYSGSRRAGDFPSTVSRVSRSRNVSIPHDRRLCAVFDHARSPASKHC